MVLNEVFTICYVIGYQVYDKFVIQWRGKKSQMQEQPLNNGQGRSIPLGKSWPGSLHYDFILNLC